VLKPGRKYLLHTLEYIALPPELVGIVELRSTLARLGLLIPPTVVDGGFEGQLTIEVHSSSFPVRLRSGSRFLHLILMKTTTPIEKPYKGRYQGQRDVMLPKRPLEYP
ncbi:MAG: dCTP deaminase, partial [Sulfolobales archaeon]